MLVLVALDYEWMEKLPESDRNACWRLAGLMMRAYGYEKHPQVEAALFGKRAQSVWDKVATEAASDPPETAPLDLLSQASNSASTAGTL